MSKKYFWGKKYILRSGREVDLSCEEDAKGSVSMLALLNHLDSVHEITKPLSLRLEWEKAQTDPTVAIECRGGAPGQDRPVSESEMPVEGLNGEDKKLSSTELLELIEAMNSLYAKLLNEASSSSSKK
jgi:hypothetical protein